MRTLGSAHDLYRWHGLWSVLLSGPGSNRKLVVFSVLIPPLPSEGNSQSSRIACGDKAMVCGSHLFLKHEYLMPIFRRVSI